MIAGWVSVLLALKAAVDFSVDLRNHDPGRTWDQGYADNLPCRVAAYDRTEWGDLNGEG